MSLNPVPICASCGKPSEVAISCTRCLQISCTACFNGLVNATVKANVDLALLTARVCRKCNDDGQAAGSELNAATVVTDQELCRLHGKIRKLYCQNCSVAICGNCIDVGEAHDLHRIDNLAAVYLDKISRVGSRLIRAEEKNNELLAGSVVYGRNLELLEKEEESVLEEIETIAEQSRLEVFRITTTRKETLKEKLKVPLLNGIILEDVRSEAKKLSPYELLEQLPEIEHKCEELIGQESDVTLCKLDDIHCDLIPQYRFTDIVFGGFLNAAMNTVCVSRLTAAYDVEWKLTVTKGDMLRIEANAADDPVVQALRHMLVVIIPHPDYTKTVHQSFELNGQIMKIDVIHLSYLVEQGFCNELTGNLEMKIGTRCCNALIERQVLSYQYNRLKAELSTVKKNLSSVTGKCDYNHLIMHFHPKLSALHEATSNYITDDKNRCWALKVNLQSNKLGLHIHLMSGTDTKCNYFIEVIHTNPLQTIIFYAKERYFNRQQTDGNGWGFQFGSLDKFKDVGFYPDGCLHIRFGVQPVASSAAPSAASA